MRTPIQKLCKKFKYTNIFQRTKIIKLQRTENDKPYINNLFNFNLSNSGYFVICCASLKHKLGIDIYIEQMKQMDISGFKFAFSHQKEWGIIIDAPRPLEEFYVLWTKKESIIKADGRGLSVNLKKISVTNNKATIHDNDTVWYPKKLGIDKIYLFYTPGNELFTPIYMYSII